MHLPPNCTWEPDVCSKLGEAIDLPRAYGWTEDGKTSICLKAESKSIPHRPVSAGVKRVPLNWDRMRCLQDSRCPSKETTSCWRLGILHVPRNCPWEGGGRTLGKFCSESGSLCLRTSLLISVAFVFGAQIKDKTAELPESPLHSRHVNKRRKRQKKVKS